ncbi:hypothetical protein NEF87_003510 [Candidatus Lokiarchaeum ossiferum]|uniref:MalT-like TPR region domain-containing protein n=1 Tax=Candidatus Lokiarchaeum ossiferum TaxID=2951803 RepID=A0ABY6HUW9_9ARCH|nr:hypothetical protein NEF87_003510 [Candidatus Lokiarchaeum sp. B-35]
MVDFTKKYEKIKNLFNLCKYNEALLIIKELDEKYELSKQNRFLIKLEHIRILNLKANYQEVITLALEFYRKCQLEGFPLISLDFIIECVESYYRSGKLEQALKYIEFGQQLISALHDISQKEVTKREAMLGYYYCAILWTKGSYDSSTTLLDDLLQKQRKFGNKKEIAKLLVSKSVINNAAGQIDVGLQFLMEAEENCREINDISYLTIIYNNIGWIYQRIGHFEKALSYLKKSSEIISKTENISLYCSILDNIGNIYRQLGDLEQSHHYLLQAINIGEKLGNNYRMTNIIFSIIRTLLEQQNIEEAQQYLLQFEKIVEIEQSKNLIFRFKIAQAFILKASHRARDRYQAQTILLDLVQEKNYEFDYMIHAIINLCELLITDLKTTNEQEIITEIDELITRLQHIAKKSGSHSILGETLLLRAKLSLILLDFIESRKFLIEAQKIAEKNGLTKLAIHVSNEHDKILLEESKLMEMKNTKAGLSERVQYSGIQEQIAVMNLEKGYTNSEVKEEQPLLFVIMNETGTALYKHSFSHSLSIDEQMLSAFLSAMNSFCTELFADSFDRAIIGDSFLALARAPPFVFCYIFKGNSYFAQSKIKQFLKNFNANQYGSKDILTHSLDASCFVCEKDRVNITNVLFNSFQLENE